MSDTQRALPAQFLGLSANVASFYGFKPLKDIERGLTGRHRGLHSFSTSIEACSNRMNVQKTTEPILTYYATSTPTNLPYGVSGRDVGEFGLHVVGSQESLGEILLLKTIFSIMTEWGSGVANVRVNALGDRDSKARFERELHLYVKKHATSFDLPCQEMLQKNPMALYSCTNEACRELLLCGPHALNFLSEKSRAHFREVLEYIESLGLPYQVDDLLVGDEREPRVIFSLDLASPDETLLCGIGGRFDEYLRRVTNKKESAAVSASIFFKKKGITRGHFASMGTSASPKIYFVQLGLRAKLQSLAVVDMLRAAGVPIAQSFDAQSLGPQLQYAREQGVKHLLIMGQREALDGTIIVRSANNSSQTTVPLAGLPRFLKTLKM